MIHEARVNTQVDFHQQLFDEKEIVYTHQCTGRELTHKKKHFLSKKMFKKKILEVVKALSVDRDFSVQ